MNMQAGNYTLDEEIKSPYAHPLSTNTTNTTNTTNINNITNITNITNTTPTRSKYNSSNGFALHTVGSPPSPPKSGGNGNTKQKSKKEEVISPWIRDENYFHGLGNILAYNINIAPNDQPTPHSNHSFKLSDETKRLERVIRDLEKTNKTNHRMYIIYIYIYI